MRKTVRKLFFIWSLDEEEAWLNQMAAQGWCLAEVGFCSYVFEQCRPGEYVIRVDFLKRSVVHTQSLNYINFVLSTGAERIKTRANGNAVYFRKRADSGFALSSDNRSRIQYYDRILKQIGIGGASLFLVGIDNIISLFGVKEDSLFVLHLILGLISIAFVAFCLKGLIKNYKRRKALKKELQLFE